MVCPWVVSGRRSGARGSKRTCRSIGRALLERTIELAREAGADGIHLNTGETDTAARSLYESMGFTNREGSPDGPSMLFYELEF
jgi:ribosomal protein S18 acetylase RimI-like enzyme